MTSEGKVVEEQTTSLEGFRLEMKDLKITVQRLQIELESNFSMVRPTTNRDIYVSHIGPWR